MLPGANDFGLHEHAKERLPETAQVAARELLQRPLRCFNTDPALQPRYRELFHSHIAE